MLRNCGAAYSPLTTSVQGAPALGIALPLLYSTTPPGCKPLVESRMGVTDGGAEAQSGQRRYRQVEIESLDGRVTDVVDQDVTALWEEDLLLNVVPLDEVGACRGGEVAVERATLGTDLVAPDIVGLVGQRGLRVAIGIHIPEGDQVGVTTGGQLDLRATGPEALGCRGIHHVAVCDLVTRADFRGDGVLAIVDVACRKRGREDAAAERTVQGRRTRRAVRGVEGTPARRTTWGCSPPCRTRRSGPRPAPGGPGRPKPGTLTHLSCQSSSKTIEWPGQLVRVASAFWDC